MMESSPLVVEAAVSSGMSMPRMSMSRKWFTRYILPSALAPEGRSMAQEEKVESVTLFLGRKEERFHVSWGRQEIFTRVPSVPYSYGVSLQFDGQSQLSFGEGWKDGRTHKM